MATYDTRKEKPAYKMYKIVKTHIEYLQGTLRNIIFKGYKDVCSDFDGKLFHNAAPLIEKLFCPLGKKLLGYFNSPSYPDAFFLF